MKEKGTLFRLGWFRWALYLGIVVLSISGPAVSGSSSLIRDIHDQPAPDLNFPMAPFPLGSDGLVVASDIRTGTELYLRNGASGALSLIKDIRPGSAGSGPREFRNFAGTVLFIATDGDSLPEFWRTDGTSSGTRPFFNPWPGGKLQPTGRVWQLGSNLIFEGKLGSEAAKLWRTDGTVGGTFALSGQTVVSGSNKAMVVGTTFYFVSSTVTNGAELWKSNGTVAGTVLVRDIQPGTTGSSPDLLFNLGDTVIMAATTSTHGRELWKSAGTSATTLLVKDIHMGGSSNPEAGAVWNGVGLFWATDTASGLEIWKTNGTADGTVLIKDINPGSAFATNNPGLTSGPGGLFFAASDGVHGVELWKTDGSAGGTGMVKDIREGAGESLPLGRLQSNGLLYFRADNGIHGSELWRSDGTSAGTWMIKDLRPGALGSNPSATVTIDSRVIFTATLDGTTTTRWETDGTESGTLPNAEYSTTTASSDPKNPFRWKDRIWFSAIDREGGNELWSTDGVQATRAADLNPGLPGSDPVPLGVAGGHLLIAASTAELGRELWRVNGSNGQIELVKDLNTGDYAQGQPYWGSPQGLYSDGDRLFFTATTLGFGRELWSTDGTSSGTTLVREFIAGGGDGGITSVGKLGATYFVSAYHAPFSNGLWAMDQKGVVSALLRTDLSSTAFTAFGTNSTFTGNGELFASNGTTTGTIMLKEFTPGMLHGGVYETAWWNGKMWMSVIESGSNSRIWSTDGTVVGTSALAGYGDGNLLTTRFCPTPFALFFTGGSSAHGRELWTTDGGTDGSAMVADLSPGSASSTFDWLHSSGNGVYFSIASTAHGKELWRSDGSSLGTSLAEDLVPGDGASNPQPLGVVNGRFVFAATTDTVGREPRARTCGGPHLVLENDGGFQAPPVGWTLDLPVVTPGAEGSRVLNLKNIGDAPVTGLSMQITSLPQSGITVTGVLPTTLAPGASAQMTARFAPSASGRFSSTVRISVDSIVQFSFHLFGWAIGADDSWRNEQFGSPLPMGIADEAGDPDKDGRINLLERAFGTSPHFPDASAVLRYDKTERCFRFQWVGELRSGCFIVPEWSDSLEPESWSPIGLHATTTILPGDRREVEVSPSFESDSNMFLRLRVVGGTGLLE